MATYPVVYSGCDKEFPCGPDLRARIFFQDETGEVWRRYDSISFIDSRHFKSIFVLSWKHGSGTLLLILEVKNNGNAPGSGSVDLKWSPSWISFNSLDAFCVQNASLPTTVRCSVGLLRRKQSVRQAE